MPSKYLQAFKTVGLRGIWRHMMIMKDVKIGTFVGRDRLGNEYYESNIYEVGPGTFALHSVGDHELTHDGWYRTKSICDTLS